MNHGPWLWLVPSFSASEAWQHLICFTSSRWEKSWGRGEPRHCGLVPEKIRENPTKSTVSSSCLVFPYLNRVPVFNFTVGHVPNENDHEMPTARQKQPASESSDWGMVFGEASFGGLKHHWRLEPQRQKEVCRSPGLDYRFYQLIGIMFMPTTSDIAGWRRSKSHHLHMDVSWNWVHLVVSPCWSTKIPIHHPFVV